MKPGRFTRTALLAGTMVLALGLGRPALADIPTGFKDVGMSGGSGSVTITGTGADAVWDVKAIGEDLGGAADRGYFVYTDLPGDGGVTARVLSLTGGSTGGWAKIGVMLRDNTDAGSPMITYNYTSKGKNHATAQLEYLARSKAKAATPGAGADRDLAAGPIWLRAQRQGQKFQVLRSDNGKDWVVASESTIPIDPAKSILAGISSSSQSKTLEVQSTVDNVSVSADIVQPNILPGPTGIQPQPGNGAVLLTYQTVPNAAYNVYRRVAGSKDPAVRVNAEPTANGWFIDTGLTNGTNYLYSLKTVTKSLADPTQLLEGAASSEVLVMPQTPTNGFALYYFGTTNPGTVSIDNNVLTITAAGSDIWDTTQSGEFLARPVAGDYSIRATILEQPTAKDKAGKAGVMIRGDALADSRNAYLFASAGRTEEILFEGRTDYAATGKPAAFSQTITKVADAKFPLTLMLSKTGGTVTAYTSLDGTNFTQAGTPVSFGALPVSYTGIAATAHKEATLVTAKFDAASIQIGAPYTPPAPAPAP
jgi:regulation of enolase protein 1 (concanavalin A-like superfamily)